MHTCICTIVNFGLPLDMSFFIAVSLSLAPGRLTAPKVPSPLTLLNKYGYLF